MKDSTGRELMADFESHRDARRITLFAAGYQGLYYPGECGCTIEDLAPCGDLDCLFDCQPGYRLTGADMFDFYIGQKPEGAS
jgi:hypothetical protein